VSTEDGTTRGRWSPGVWAFAAAIVICLVVVVARLGGFVPWVDVDGGEWVRRMPNGLASVDHPFHTARAEILRRAIADGELPSWIASHQGGYPVFFYPLGAAWMTLGWWVIGLGRLPIEWAHLMSVATIAVLPVVGFALLARRDRLPWTVPVLALVLQLVVPGAWWHGGWTELVQWGLVTNVAGAAWLFAALGLLIQTMNGGSRRWMAAAACAAAMALVTNPRSVFGLVVVCVAVPIAALSVCRRDAWAKVIVHSATVGAVSVLLAAPVILPLVIFRQRYVFVHYGTYETVGAYVRSTVDAVWWPIAVVAVIGMVGCWLPAWTRDQPPLGMRTLSLAAVLYAALTLASSGDHPLVAQLEPTRLMPFQRLVVIALAAGAMGWLADQGLARVVPSATLRAGVPMVAAALVAIFWLRPGGPALPDPADTRVPTRGMFAVQHTGTQSQVSLEAAILRAEAAAAPGTAVAVIGSDLSWHQQLWGPRWSPRRFYYNDWLWYWTDLHDGTPGYAADRGHFYPDPDAMLDPSFLREHGIGAVVALGPVVERANEAAWLDPLSGEAEIPPYRAWVVRDAIPTITVGDSGLKVDPGTEGEWQGRAATSGDLIVRQQAFPGWVATVGDEVRSLDVLPDGMMAFGDVAEGVTISVAFHNPAVTWVARALLMIGVIALGVLAVHRSPDVAQQSEGSR